MTIICIHDIIWEVSYENAKKRRVDMETVDRELCNKFFICWEQGTEEHIEDGLGAL